MTSRAARSVSMGIHSFIEQCAMQARIEPLDERETEAVLQVVRTWSQWSTSPDEELARTAWEGPVDHLVGNARPALCDIAWWEASRMTMACMEHVDTPVASDGAVHIR